MTRISSWDIRRGQHTSAHLTARQVAIVRLAAKGHSGKQIARHLGISVRTVQGHFHDMRQRTGTRGQGELIAYAAGAGLLAPGNFLPGKPASRPGRESATIAGVPGDPATAARDETRDETQLIRSGAGDETVAGTSRCQICGTGLAPAHTGRPRRYCTRACQARAYRTRQALPRC
jgi:DNA-binding CsgD family transcriptional regulator